MDGEFQREIEGGRVCVCEEGRYEESVCVSVVMPCVVISFIFVVCGNICGKLPENDNIDLTL